MTNIEKWRFYLKDIESPDIFIDWAFYGMISCALARRVSIGDHPHIAHPFNIYPNIFLVFVGPPGVGKTISLSHAKSVLKSFEQIDPAKGIRKEPVKLGPDSITVEQLTRYLHLNYTHVEIPKEISGKLGAIYTSSPLAFICADELASLVRTNTQDLIVFLTQGWDCGDFHRETKTQGIDLIKNMCLTLLGCATQNTIAEMMGMSLMKEGFTSRAIFVYADKKRFLNYSYELNVEQKRVHLEVKAHVKELTKLFGKVELLPETKAWCENWYMNAKALNRDKRLEEYYARKRMHLNKVAMLMHFADDCKSLTLTIKDFEKALALLAKTELDMHRAFYGTEINPVANIAERIKVLLTERDKAPRELLVETFPMLKNGKVDFDAAVNFLRETDQIIALPGDRECIYSLVREASTSLSHSTGVVASNPAVSLSTQDALVNDQ